MQGPRLMRCATYRGPPQGRLPHHMTMPKESGGSPVTNRHASGVWARAPGGGVCARRPLGPLV
jgi:hypothetical protein